MSQILGTLSEYLLPVRKSRDVDPKAVTDEIVKRFLYVFAGGLFIGSFFSWITMTVMLTLVLAVSQESVRMFMYPHIQRVVSGQYFQQAYQLISHTVIKKDS